MKKSILVLTAILFFSVSNVFSQGGNCGKNLKWQLSNDTLTISGTGEMYNYEAPEGGPWPKFLIKTIIIDSGVASIGNGAFFLCYYLSSISIPNSVTKIGIGSFSSSGLQSIILPDGVSEIGNCAFLQSALTSITLPSSITRIGNGAFYECPLSSITNLNLIPIDINAGVFDGTDIKNCTLKVPKNSIDAYKKAPVWQDFKIVGIEVGIDEYEKETDNSGEQLLIYPNPNTGTCSIIIPEEFQNERFLTLSIYDNSGKKVQEISIDNENPAYSLKLDSKAAGVYVAVLSNGKRSVRGRIVFN